MNIIVTGSCGFIGFHACLLLLKNNYKIIGIDNLNNYYDVDLNKNRLKILSISESMFKTNSKDLSLEFLLEITKRSNYFQQI